MNTTITEQIDPTTIADKICHQYFFNLSTCLYNGIANAIVAGSKKKLIIFPPVLYSSKVKLPTFKKTIPNTIATNNGVNKKNPFECLNNNVPIPYAINETTIPKYGVIVLAMFIPS